MLLLSTGVSLAFFMGPIQGDLVRIGKLTERFFGPQREQAHIDRLSNPPAVTPGILVLGDSFSQENIWQSWLAQSTGLFAQTYHYDELPCIDRWIRDAIGGRVVGGVRMIVISTVERSFLERFGGEMSSCDAPVANYRQRQIEAGLFPQKPSPYDLFPMNIAHLLGAVRNQIRVLTHNGRLKFDRAVVVDLSRGDLFSNRLSDKLLYYGDDDRNRRNATVQTIERAIATVERYREMAKRAGVTLVFNVVPDKSSVYAPWISAGQGSAIESEVLFRKLAESLGPSADMLTLFRRKAAQIQDFYSPNDTHLSVGGYRVLADQLTLMLKDQSRLLE